MKTFDELRQILSLQMQSLCEIYQITEIGIFGSYAKGFFPTPHSLSTQIISKIKADSYIER